MQTPPRPALPCREGPEIAGTWSLELLLAGKACLCVHAYVCLILVLFLCHLCLCVFGCGCMSWSC